MKLKLDLHDIFSDGRQIEEALQRVMDEAVEKRAAEVEIIPGKGSGALKKTVLRFLERPEIKSRYHRMEKDGDNWGRLFVHFRHDRVQTPAKQPAAAETVAADCACCGGRIAAPAPDDAAASPLLDCPWCGSPNRLTFRRDRRGALHARVELDYGDTTSA